MLRQAGLHQFVVYVVLVGVKQRLAVAQSVQRHSDHVGRRHEEQRDGHHDGLGPQACLPDYGVVHGAFDGQKTQSES